MRICLLAFACLVTCTTSFARQPGAFEAAIGWRGNNIQLHTITSKDKKQTCLFLVSADSIRAFWMDPYMKPLRQFGIPRRSNEQILGGFIRNEKVCLFSQMPGEKAFHSYTFHTTNGDVTENMLAFDTEREKIVDRISCGDHFLYFTVNKKTKEFIIYDFASDSAYTSFHHHFGEGIWENLTTASFFSRAINAEKIDIEGEPAIESAQCPNKIYVLQDTLYLIMNNVRDQTRVFAFDLASRQVKEKTFYHYSAPVVLQDAWTYNSILSGDQLYYVQATNDSLVVEVLNIHNGQLIKTFRAGSKEDIPFKNSPITQEGGAYSSKSVRELDKTRQLLRKMVNGKAIILASRQDAGGIVLTIGSYT